MNDPTCKVRNNPNHTCYDKFGERWDRGNIGPRPGTRCEAAIAIDAAAATLTAEMQPDAFVAALDYEEATTDALGDLLAAEDEARMQALGDLLASTMDPDDEDRDDCGMVLGD